MSPSDILTTISPLPREAWMVIIMIYFAVATIIPINKLIAKVYPLFGAGMILLGVGMAVVLFASGGIAKIPEFSFGNPHPRGIALFPYLFVTIACGAISGFHATQSPLMARCIGNEREGRMVFYGAMIFEGFLALIWAAVAMTYFPGGLAGLAAAGVPAHVVSTISFGFFGTVGGILAIICVGIFPISTGDTALRASRLAIADALKLDQGPIRNRFIITIPLFAVVVALLFIDFGILWRYFAWMNQTLAVFTLWAAAVYLARKKLFHWICTLPAVFMTFMTMTYIFIAAEGFRLPYPVGLSIGGAITAGCIIVFTRKNMLAGRGRLLTAK
jgi:carbon starvation protein CstA